MRTFCVPSAILSDIFI